MGILPLAMRLRLVIEVGVNQRVTITIEAAAVADGITSAHLTTIIGAFNGGGGVAFTDGGYRGGLIMMSWTRMTRLLLRYMGRRC